VQEPGQGVHGARQQDGIIQDINRHAAVVMEGLPDAQAQQQTVEKVAQAVRVARQVDIKHSCQVPLCCISGLVDVHIAQLVALLARINRKAACVLNFCVHLLTLLYATLLTLLNATATSCQTHHVGVGAGVKQKHKVFASEQSLLRLQHCSRPAHADTHFVRSNRVRSRRLRRGQMLDKAKAKLQASAMTCKLSGA